MTATVAMLQLKPVRCPACRKVLAEATPGSTVKRRCDRCKAFVLVTVPKVA